MVSRFPLVVVYTVEAENPRSWIINRVPFYRKYLGTSFERERTCLVLVLFSK